MAQEGPPRRLIRGGTRTHTVAHQVGTRHFRARVSIRVAALGSQGNTCSRLAAFFLIACVLSFFMLLGKPKRMLPRFLMSWHNLGGKLCRLRCWGCHTTLWKPIGGCSFTGSPTALPGNSAFRFCLLMQWRSHAVDPHHTPFGHGIPPDPDVEPVAPLRETDSELLVRQLLQAATDQHSQECRSQTPSEPQNQQPCLFVPWKTVAEQVGIPAVQAVPLPNLRDGVLHAVSLLPEPQQQEFRAAYTMPLSPSPP